MNIELIAELEKQQNECIRLVRKMSEALHGVELSGMQVASLVLSFSHMMLKHLPKDKDLFDKITNDFLKIKTDCLANNDTFNFSNKILYESPSRIQ